MKYLTRFIIVTVFTFASLPAFAASEAPNIKLPTSTGEVDLSALRGKVVYLDFWASWCKPCLKSFPWMVEMKSTYVDQGLEIIAVNLDKDRKLADKFLRKLNVNFPVAFDPAGNTATQYKLLGMPSSYLIGRDGKLHASHIGFREKDKPLIEAAIRQLLKL